VAAVAAPAPAVAVLAVELGPAEAVVGRVEVLWTAAGFLDAKCATGAGRDEGRRAESLSEDTDPEYLICGQPRTATTALAKTNAIAAPASSEPAVPKPAMYARVARIRTLRHERLAALANCDSCDLLGFRSLIAYPVCHH